MMFKTITKKLADRRKLSGWEDHVNAKFKQYESLWTEAYRSWRNAQARGDREAALECFERQGLYLRAEQLAHRDMALPVSERLARWDVDYVEEARSSLSFSTDYNERMHAVEKIMLQTPREGMLNA